MINCNLNLFTSFFFFFFFSSILVLLVKFYSSGTGQSSLLSYINPVSDSLLWWCFFLNYFFIYLYSNSFQTVLVPTNVPLLKGDSLFLISVSLIYIYFLLSTSTKMGGYIFFLVINVFFMLVIFMVSSTNFLDVLVCLEFINMLIFLFLTITLFFQVNTSNDIQTVSQSKNITYNSYFFFFNSLSTFFFFIFFLSIYFFLFFFIFYFYKFDSMLFFNIRELSLYYKNDNLIVILLLILTYKLGGAPAHLWKIEVFNNSKLNNLLFYSIVYLFYSFFIYYFLFLKLSSISLNTKNFILFILIIFNAAFIASNVNSVLTVRHFIILSTLINSSFFFLSIILFNELRVNFFFGFFFNYVVSSYFIFFFFYVSNNKPLLIDISLTKNNYINVFFFLIPLVSLSGTAPSFAFILKLLFLINSWALVHFFIFFLIICNIVITSVFYFQFFKNFFNKSKSLSKKQLKLNNKISRGSALITIAPALLFSGVPLYSLYLYFENLYLDAKVAY